MSLRRFIKRQGGPKKQIENIEEPNDTKRRCQYVNSREGKARVTQRQR